MLSEGALVLTSQWESSLVWLSLHAGPSYLTTFLAKKEKHIVLAC